MKIGNLLKITLLAIFFLGGKGFAQIQNFEWQGVQREYLVKTPENTESMPVMFFLHGLGDNITRLDNEFHFQQIADEFKWMVVVPQALNEGYGTMWNAGMSSSTTNDHGFLMALLDSLAVEYPVNHDSVFFTGFSMGGFMSHCMAIRHGDRINAAAPVSGLISSPYANMTPVAPVRMLHIHGTTDPVVGYDGGSQYFGYQLGLSVENILNYWKNANNCTGEPVIDSLPDTHNDGMRFVSYTWSGDKELRHLKVIGGNHDFFHNANQYDVDYIHYVHDFFTGKLDNPGGETGCTRTELYHPGDYGSANYRIPAVITAKDGSIVAVTDKRKYNEGDLPQDIVIVCNRSTDGGLTWSEPYTIALGTGVNHGFGDCALAWSNDDNGLIAVFVGGVGLWNSTPTNPIRSYKSYSYDNGITWTQPEDITDFIFGANCIVPEHQSWRASFFGSGNGLRTSTGRIMFVAAIREGSAQSLNNYAVYSDDNGLTWQVSGRASVGGDEAKVTELVDGRILMSIRHAGNRWYNISEDGGETWQPTTSTWYDITAPACNGDLIRYTSVAQGSNKNRLLHSVPKGTSRTDVTVYISYDEGETWPVSKTIVPYSSAYSSLCVLPDGTIGLYVEEEPNGTSGYSTAFYNFTLEWLTDGNDSLEDDAITENTTTDSLKIYPVPASSYIMIEAENISKIKIYDMQGRVVKKKSVGKPSNINIDVSDLPTGTYLVEAFEPNGVSKIGKFVK